MKASELIKELERQISENGDCVVYYENTSDYGHYSEIDNLKIENAVYILDEDLTNKPRTINQKSFILDRKTFIYGDKYSA